ncbi:SWI SNF2 family ATpase with a HSA domain at the N-terminus [Cryptosporidium xiaoi]|uniref:SWI SNF2 family ATpase with a HSA domain at the N-terminus n=1 Tax=Cryptosporidium xiaoi TaxID=659607 RepID=A0AAV9Y1W1_9CRYT
MSCRGKNHKNKSLEIEPPKEVEDHQDFLLKESKWMYDCFINEHKWKARTFKLVAQSAVKYLQTKDQRLKKRKEEEDKRLRLVSKNISSNISKFWQNISKVVRHKKISELNKQLRIKQFEKLDKLVQETERYFERISIVPDPGNKAKRGEISPKNSESNYGKNYNVNDNDNDSFHENDNSDFELEINEFNDIVEKDIKLDLEMETSEDDLIEIDTELKELNEDANMNLEELYRKYYGQMSEPNVKSDVLQEPFTPIMDEHISVSSDYYEDENEGSEEFVPELVDNEELEAEKDMSDADREDCDGWEEECAALENEKEIPLEQLISKMKQYENEKLSDDLNENDNSGSDLDTHSDHKLSYSSNDTENDVCGDSNENTTGGRAREAPFQVEIPFLLRLSMREYQHTGLTWLVKLYKGGLNGILADEMGLGKTIQTISLLAYIACYHENWGPHLIVVPTSVMLNWEMEFKRWLPGFKVITYFGTPKERQKKRTGWSDPNSFNVCIASYTLILQDAHIFRRKQWKYLILDEAQNIKNFRSQKWQVMLSFNTERRLLLTGTPLQNNLMELWSLLHFLMPHIFTSHYDFKTWFSDPLTSAIENQQVENEKNLLSRLHSVLRPFLLRRLKRDVEKEMPSKIEHVIRCPLSKRQKELYDEFLESKNTQKTLLGGDYIGLMNILMQLRKVCNHPDLFEPKFIKTPIVESGLMVSASTHSLLYITNIYPTITSDVPSLGPNIKTNNYLFHKKSFSNNTDGQPLFEKLFKERIVNLPNLFLLYNEIKYSKYKANMQSELSYAKWLEKGTIYTRNMEQMENKTNISNLDFKRSGYLPDINHFIKLHLDYIACSNASDFQIIGLESNYVNNCLNSNAEHFFAANNKTKGKGLNMSDKEQVSENHCNNWNIDLTKDDKTSLYMQWSPSCEFPHLIDDSIQLFHKNSTNKSKSVILCRFPQNFCPQKVLFGTDLRRFLFNEFRCIKSDVFCVGNTLTSSSFPKIRNSYLNSKCNSNFNLPNPIYCQYSDSLSSSAFISKTNTLDHLLFVKTNYSKQLPILKLLIILLSSKVISTVKFINLEGKYSITKREAYNNSFSPKVTEEIRLNCGELHSISSLYHCIFPPRRTIEDDCGKFQVLSKLLHKLSNDGHRCIIFTQMSKMLDILEAFINLHGYNYIRLDGSTKVDERQKLVNRFNRDKRIFLFISSTRSGGVGLNLTGADTVIFYDSDWNPAMDRQAMDRCHRIGQTRDVSIYRLISEWTIEENIFRKQLQKRLLDDVVVDQGHFTTEFITKNDIQKMIGSRTNNMLKTENNDIYTTRVLHEGLNSSNLNNSYDEQNKKEFEDVLAKVEDMDDLDALKKSSKEIDTEKCDFINEFEEEKTTNTACTTLPAEKNDDSTIDSNVNKLLGYCINFFENIAMPEEIQNEIELLKFQIENIDKLSTSEESEYCSNSENSEDILDDEDADSDKLGDK